jgi:virulence-associated protein VapD
VYLDGFQFCVRTKKMVTRWTFFNECLKNLKVFKVTGNTDFCGGGLMKMR